MVFALCGLLVMNANIARADDNVPVTTDTSVDASVVSTTAVSPDNTVTTLPDVVVVVSDASSTPVVASIVDTSAIDATTTATSDTVVATSTDIVTTDATTTDTTTATTTSLVDTIVSMGSTLVQNVVTVFSTGSYTAMQSYGYGFNTGVIPVNPGYGYDSTTGATTTTTDLSLSIVTDPATDITQTTATFNGTVVSDGGYGVHRDFVYGTTTGYGNLIDTDMITGDDAGIKSAEFRGSLGNFSTPLHGPVFTCGTTYHYAAHFTNSNGQVALGEDQTFTTLPCDSTTTTTSTTTTDSVSDTTSSDAPVAPIQHRNSGYVTDSAPTPIVISMPVSVFASTHSNPVVSPVKKVIHKTTNSNFAQVKNAKPIIAVVTVTPVKQNFVSAVKFAPFSHMFSFLDVLNKYL